MKLRSLTRGLSRLAVLAALLYTGTALAADVHVMISAGFYKAYSDSASGIYLSTVLFEKLGIAGQLATKGRKIKGPPSGEPVAAVVARGEAEMGFQQVSELIHEPGVTFVGTIPVELQPDTFYAGAIAGAVTQPEAAEALIRFLASDKAASAIANAGLTPLSR